MLCLLVIMTVGYAAFQTNLSIAATGNIKEPGRVIQSWIYTDTTDFHSDYYKENIVSVTFLDTNKVPNNATESWDVSEDGKGGVIAYVVPTVEDNTKYDLYIGADGGVIANQDSSYLFEKFESVISINFNNNFDTSNTTKMTTMLGYLKSLKEIDISSLDTSLVTDMPSLFRCDISLTALDLSSLNTNNVTSMSNMFSTWDGYNNAKLNSALEKITFGENFTTENVTDMESMFYGLSIKELDLSNFDTSKVTDMYHMFAYNNSLTSLNLCSFNTSNVTTMKVMFEYSSNLQNIFVGPNWTTEKANTTNMFYNSGVSEVTYDQC